jgi:hypothetical protein
LFVLWYNEEWLYQNWDWTMPLLKDICKDGLRPEFGTSPNKSLKQKYGFIQYMNLVPWYKHVGYSAWSLREQNPNAYYYRFNEPGEKQRNGKWTEAEKKLFFDRMKEVIFDSWTSHWVLRSEQFTSSNERFETFLSWNLETLHPTNLINRSESMDSGGFFLVQFQVVLATSVQISIGRYDTHTNTNAQTLSLLFFTSYMTCSICLKNKHLIEYLHFSLFGTVNWSKLEKSTILDM